MGLSRSKKTWIILGIIVLIILGILNWHFHSKNIRYSSAAGGAFACINKDGPCQGKNLLSSCTTVDGKSGSCVGKITNQWTFDCTCSPSKTPQATN